MTTSISQYLHVQCDAFALLINSEHVEEVIGSGGSVEGKNTLTWRELQLPVVDLNEILDRHRNVKQHRDWLIIRHTKNDADEFLAVAVGGVKNIEAIEDKAFAKIPNLAFPYNDYFDRAYIHPQTQQCIYRLREAALFEHINGTLQLQGDAKP